MASTIRTDKVGPADGSADFTLPTADGSAKSALITSGSKVLSFATGTPSASNFLRGDGTWAAPAGGLSFAQQWRITSDLAVSTSDTPLYANWAKPTGQPDSPGSIGADMSVDSASSGDLSGAWTFPDTGVWYILWRMQGLCNTGNHAMEVYIWVTEDTGTGWEKGGEAYLMGQTSQTQPYMVDYMIEVSNVSTHKIRMSAVTSADTTTILGNSTKNECCVTFIKLGDAS